MTLTPTGRLGARGSRLGLLALGAAGLDILRPAREFTASARSLSFGSQDRPTMLAASQRSLVSLAEARSLSMPAGSRGLLFVAVPQ